MRVVYLLGKDRWWHIGRRIALISIGLVQDYGMNHAVKLSVLVWFGIAFTSGAKPPVTLIERGTVWKYLDDGSEQFQPERPALPFYDLDYDDSEWESGPGPLGYGDENEATVLRRKDTIYFRRKFTVSTQDLDLDYRLYIELLRDDGAVIYLNGVEVHRSNVKRFKLDVHARAWATIGVGVEGRLGAILLDPDLWSTTSASATLILDAPPEIVSISNHVKVSENDAVELFVDAQGSGTMSYQWYRDNAAVPGATSTSFLIESVTQNEIGMYSVEISNLFGSITSEPVNVTIVDPPIFTQLPVGTTLQSGKRLRLEANARSASALTWQWYKDGWPIPGATEPILDRNSVSVKDSGEYSVSVSNGAVTIESESASVLVWASEWVMSQEIRGSEDNFSVYGIAISVDGDMMALGAPDWKHDGREGGAVHLFERQSAGDWRRVAELRPTPYEGGADFGASVALSGSRLVVGAPKGNAAYVFTRSPFAWSQSKRLRRPDTTEFGESVAIQGDFVIVGERNGFSAEVHVFDADNGFDFHQALSPEPPSKYFGTSIAVDDSHLVIGAWGDDEHVYDGGAVFVYTLHEELREWAPETKITLAEPREEDQFGFHVAVDGDFIAASVPSFQVSSRPPEVHLYKIDPSDSPKWRHHARIARPEGLTNIYFGVNLDLDGPALLLGPSQESHLYRYSAISDTWTLEDTLAVDQGRSSGSGGRVVLEEDLVVVGAWGSTDKRIVNTFRPGIQIVSQPQSMAGLVGASIELGVEAIGAGELQYKWLFDGVEIPGETSATLVIASLENDVVGKYSVEISDGQFSVFSQEVDVRIASAPKIVVQPASQDVPEGVTVEFEVEAEGGPGLSFSWEKDGVVIQGASESKLILSDVGPPDAGDYRVRVRSGAGDAVSDSAMLVVGDLRPLLLQKIEGPSDQDGVANIGSSIDLNDGIVALGLPGFDQPLLETGKVWLYQPGSSQLPWDLSHEIVPAPASEGQRFGSGVAITREFLFCGSRDNGDEDLVPVTVYRRDPWEPARWMSVAPLDQPEGSRLGASIRADETSRVASVGNGTVASYRRNPRKSSGWELVEILIPDDVVDGDEFGRSVRMSDGILGIAAANQDGGGGFAKGAVYIYE